MKYSIAGSDFQSDNPQDMYREWYRKHSDPARMLASSQDAWRQIIVTAFDLLPDVQSVFELACGAGPNLKLLSEQRSDLRLGGCDWSEQLVKTAAAYGQIWQAEMPCTVPSEFDAVLSCYSLAYLERTDVATQLHALKNKYVVLVEPMTEGYSLWALPNNGSLAFWSHDYHWVLTKLDYEIMYAQAIENAPDNLNMIMIARRK